MEERLDEWERRGRLGPGWDGPGVTVDPDYIPLPPIQSEPDVDWDLYLNKVRASYGFPEQ